MGFDSIVRAGVCFAGFCFLGYAQTADHSANKEKEVDALAARAAPGEYPAQAKAGTVTVAAEFDGHYVPLPGGEPLTTEDFIVIEAAIFGESGARLVLSTDDFSLLVNDSKKPLPSQHYSLIVRSLKDPQAEPPSKSSKPKTSLNGADSGDSTPAPVKVPVETQRAWAQRLRRASLETGERELPQAGLLFFPYRSRTQSIHSMQLIYSGPGGKATLDLQP